MRLPLLFLATALALFQAATANPPVTHDKRSTVERGGVVYNVFEHAATGSKLESAASSRICEKSKKVKQYSGYATVGPGMHMWFWFFEARQNPSTAPLVAWLSGDPKVSSMHALFNGNGPCKFKDGKHHKRPKKNPHSFNNYANMIYIDWQIGTGFSQGNESVTSAREAAPYVWNLLQTFYSSFPEYRSRDFGIFTDSYGAKYGPVLAKYILDQNKDNAGRTINVVALGVSNGLHDWRIQGPACIEYAHSNRYRKVIEKPAYDNYMSSFRNYCLPRLDNCAKYGDNSNCTQAYKYLNDQVLSNIKGFVKDPYDIRKGFNSGSDSEKYVLYLGRKRVMKKIGARVPFRNASPSTLRDFEQDGDFARPFLLELSEIVSSNIPTLLWAGDAELLGNWKGVLDVANSITYAGQNAFVAKPQGVYRVNGNIRGKFKTEGNLSFLKVYNAGHALAHDQPEVSLQAFIQIMKNGAIGST